MKKTLLFLLLYSGIASAQIVTIPDANFKNKLIASGIDTNNDGNIQLTEAQAVTNLNVTNANIASLTGIAAFTNLQTLSCSANNLTTLDISSLANLVNLICFDNNITAITAVASPNLKTLSCYNNALTSIDLSLFVNLEFLSIKHNQLTVLNTTGLTALRHLDAGFNNMTTITVADKPNLVTLYLGYNQLTSVTLTNLPHAYKINVQDNQLTSLDLSSCAYEPYLNNVSNASVYDIGCNNNLGLIYINLKNGFPNPQVELMSSNLADLPQYICTDENDTIIANNTWYNTDSQFSTYCNFTPGGNYNTITGTLTYDANNNGCDANDGLFQNIKVSINDGTTSGATFSNSSGNYTFYVTQPNLTLTPQFDSPYFTVSPAATATVNFPVNNNSTQTQDFCITANGVHPDLEIVLSPDNDARPGFDAYYNLVYRNKGTEIASGTINLAFDDTLMDFMYSNQTATPATGSLSWNYTNLLPFETRIIKIGFTINTPTATPPVNSGDNLPFTATINPVTADDTPADNTFVLNQLVVNSFDPNDKTCLEGNRIALTKVGDYLHYNIRFENTGSASAINVVVKDMIDLDKLDINSLQVLYNSHPVNTQIRGNKVEFIFENINLSSANLYPEGAHGNILFKIRSKNNLVIGDVITNEAAIYFDYNHPINTDEARTVVENLLGGQDFTIDKSISIYPNPASDILNIKADNTIKSILLYDLQGRLLMTSLHNATETYLNITDKSSGIYLIKVISESGSKIEKIVKQ